MGVRDLKNIPSIELLGYSDVVRSVINLMLAEQRHASDLVQVGFLKKGTDQQINKVFEKHLVSYQDILKKTEKEIFRRVQDIFRLSANPSHLVTTVGDLRKKHPELNFTIDELHARLKKHEEIKGKAIDTKEVAKEGTNKMSNNGEAKVVIIPKEKK